MRTAAATVMAVLVLGAAAPAEAFDAGPHSDMTRDAMTAEGFGGAAADVGVVDNWFVDYYWNATENPFSGHSAWWKETLAGANVATIEFWDPAIIKGTNRMHFDSSQGADLSNPHGIEEEWQRLMRITHGLLADARAAKDPLMVLAIAGMSLHTVEDFYAHTNWVETAGEYGSPDGPGWTAAREGSAPTWFDIPKPARDAKRIYSGVHGAPRGHGKWQTDHNDSLAGGLNKDWPGRPLFEKAYLSAYFAARQWIEAMRGWLGDDALWSRAQRLQAPARLRDDLAASLDISKYSGHWQGNGQPCANGIIWCGDLSGWAGSVLGLRSAIKHYHEDVRKSPARAMFERLAPRFAADPGSPVMPELASSRTIQAQTRFVKVEVLRMNGFAFELGDPGPDDADIYAIAKIRGQRYDSPVIHDHDSFSFPKPYAPFTWIRSVPTAWRASAPVSTLTVRVETGNKRSAGTDDDVHLRVNSALRFDLNKGLYDDFERGDDDTYAVALDRPTYDGLKVADIDRLQIEKSRDGLGGGWYLKGITVSVNGTVIASNRSINRWLEDDHRTVRLSLTRDHRTRDIVPVWLRLREDDYLYGGDDDGDINLFDRNQARSVGYVPGPPEERVSTGGAKLKGRLSLDNGDRARARWRISTITVDPPPPPPPPDVAPPPPPPPDNAPPPPPPKPDLAITAFDGSSVTVKNQGAGAAGAFNIAITPGGTTIRADGLAAGASATYNWTPSACVQYTATADSSDAVAESNESNNTAQWAPSFC
jgi:hypothetical protein